MVISFPVAIALSIKFKANPSIPVILSLVELFALIISMILAIRQLVASKEIARATFITELNKSFVENSDYLDVYNKLQNCLDGSCPCGKKCEDPHDINKCCNLDISKGQISNYLTFFETIYLLKKDGVISFEVLDELFAYRFFLAVHSKIVQQKKDYGSAIQFQKYILSGV